MQFVLRILSLVIVVLALVEPALAEEAASGGAGSLAALGAGLGIGIAAFGGALGQGKAIAAVVDAIARNPGAAGQMNTPMFVGLAFMESLVLLAFLIALGLTG